MENDLQLTIIKRILKTSQSKDFKPSGINKNLYLDIIETVVDAYRRHYFERVVSGQEEAVVCNVLRAAGSLAYLSRQAGNCRGTIFGLS